MQIPNTSKCKRKRAHQSRLDTEWRHGWFSPDIVSSVRKPTEAGGHNLEEVEELGGLRIFGTRGTEERLDRRGRRHHVLACKKGREGLEKRKTNTIQRSSLVPSPGTDITILLQICYISQSNQITISQSLGNTRKKSWQEESKSADG